MHVLGHDVRHERDEERRRRREDRVVEEALGLREEPAEGEADGDAAGDHDAGTPATPGSDREVARHDRGARELQEDEARRVVHEALALENRHDLPREAHALGDGRRGDGVRRRDDGAEDEGRGPRHARHEGHDDGGDRQRRRDDETDGEER